MTVEFRCEKCGKLLNVEADPGGMAKCTQCGKKVQVPAALASLPHPQIGPGDGAPNGSMPPPLPPSPQPGAPLGPAMAGAQAPGAPGVGGEAEEEAAGSGAMGTMAMLMPWMISVFFHMGIVLVMAFFVLMSQAHKQIFEISTPEAAYPENTGAAADPGTVGPGKDPTKVGGATEFARNTNIGTIGDSANTDKTVGIFGVSSNGAAGSAGFGTLGGGGGGGGRVGFIGGPPVGNVYHIVWVIDRSGSMIDSFDYLKNAMVDSISKLKDVQDFHIIMFSDGKPIEMGQGKLVTATSANKLLAGKFLEDVNTSSGTLPVEALRRAFAVLSQAGDKPGKLIYFLSDGDFAAENEKVLQTCRDLNTGKKVMINTYLYAATEDKAGKKIMEDMAKENGGYYKYFCTKEAN